MKSLRALLPLACLFVVATAIACGEAEDEDTTVTPRGSGGRAGTAASGGRVGGNDLPGGSGGKLASGGVGGSALAGAGGSEDDEEDDVPAGAGGSGGAAGQSGGASGTSAAGGSAGSGGSSGANAGSGGSAGSGSGSAGSGAGPAVPECAYATVNTPGTVLNVRSDPSTKNPTIATLPDNTVVEVLAKVDGQVVDGTPVWYEIKGGGTEGYGYSKFIECSATKPPDPPPLDGFYLPVACGMKVKCTQGNNGTVSHKGNVAHAFDFYIPAGTPLRAAAPGTVVAIYDATVPGSPCYNGGGSSCAPYSNYVLIRHADNTQTIYKHLNKVEVAVGQVVTRGQHIGLSGKTGYATGDHIHIMRQNAGAYNAKSIPMTFSDAGVPVTNQVVTSGNCP